MLRRRPAPRTVPIFARRRRQRLRLRALFAAARPARRPAAPPLAATLTDLRVAAPAAFGPAALSFAARCP